MEVELPRKSRKAVVVVVVVKGDAWRDEGLRDGDRFCGQC